jgi:hypothetical protein
VFIFGAECELDELFFLAENLLTHIETEGTVDAQLMQLSKSIIK